MFGTIRKHQKWLWFVIIAVVIFGMATFNQMNRSDNQRRGGAGNRGVIEGRAVTETEYRNARVEADLNYFMRARQWPDAAAAQAGWHPEMETYKQIFLKRKLEQYNIHTDSDLVAQLAGLILRSFGQGHNIPLDAFEDQVLKPQGITAEDFERFLEHDLSVQQLSSIIGASGKLITPAEIQALYVQEHQDLKVDAVFFSASNYLADISEPTPAALGQFYTNEEAEYRLPDQMQISYVRFSATNYVEAEKQIESKLTNGVDKIYNELGTNVLSMGATEQERKNNIRQNIIQMTARTNAAVAANSFLKDLLEKEPARADNLNALAKEKGLEVQVTRPFDKQTGPSSLQLSSRFPVSDLFNLTSDEPFVETPVGGQDGVYIFAFNKFIPSRVPPFDEIRSQVIADYKYVEAQQIAQMNGHIFAQTVTNGLAKGQSFAAISAGAKMTPTQLPPFSVATETLPQVDDHDLTTLKQAAFNTPIGKTSEFTPLSTGGVVLYVRERLPLDQAKMNAELPDFSKAVREQRESEAFQAWFSKEAPTALRDIPALQQPRGS
jgi:hypothetical protein